MEKQKKWSRIMIGTLLVLVLAIGGTAVFAQTQTQDNPTATPPADDSSTDSTTPVLPNPFTRGDRSEFDGRGDKIDNVRILTRRVRHHC
ncbi:MAG: hypothetical protein H6669_19215 [Ardenticatenaceae bacterium]|nr:hypothetical protein [Ardenticatenaceae bacterium]